MAREKNIEKMKGAKGGQLDANKKAMNIQCKVILYDNRAIQDEILGSNVSMVIYFPQASFNIEQRSHGRRSK
ncbi:hypothetical protein H5410_023995 [Solanum commersonii]|uniref:Small EDRK-rich factor-like N-terminal domain-containing protein n=1 Tax=Solanum commersonii TaxID=4109 RepID=A0A9J5VXT6_SOLCO|nr:hypothetical protein H5410_064984 [Solanum commersonii]KAG5612714.1 hypothetical protein H5410_023995 [Solanum commersonii]